jgi:hypothetical protein
MFTKAQLLEAIKNAPNDACIIVCDANPSPDFDNTGLEVQDAAWDRNTPLEPGEKGVIYIMARGIEEAHNRTSRKEGLGNLVERAIVGLMEFYPELSDPAYADAVAKKVEVPHTGNDQADYENVRDHVERLVKPRV